MKGLLTNHTLAQHISDAAWGEFVRQLEYKAPWYGSTVVKADRFFPSSKTCSSCGAVKAKLPLEIRPNRHRLVERARTGSTARACHHRKSAHAHAETAVTPSRHRCDVP